MRFIYILVVAALIGAISVACGQSADAPAEWGYSGDTGPEHWGALDDDYAACSEGRRQSPIDITDYAPGDAPALSFAYVPDGMRVTNTGLFLKVLHEGDSRLTLGSRDYPLVNVHAHAPAEHTVDGERFPLEIHLVHQDESGEFAVVSLLYRLGEANPALQTLLDAAPQPGDTTHPTSPLDPSLHLPARTTHYTYPGSLTVPPCTETVQWLVMTEVAEVSEEQLQRIAALTTNHPTNRPTQPPHDRPITLVE